MESGTVRVLLVDETVSDASPLVAYLRNLGCLCALSRSVKGGLCLTPQGTIRPRTQQVRAAQGRLPRVVGTADGTGREPFLFLCCRRRMLVDTSSLPWARMPR